MKTGGSIYSIKKKFGYIFKKFFPKWQASRLYQFGFGRKINWKNPKEFNEKIRWLQFNTDISKWSLLADKYKVREYLEKKGYGNLLVKLYGVWEKAEDIDFSKLPDCFVIKTNHGCGSVYIVNDKHSIDLEQIRQKLKKDLSEKFGIETAETHYRNIKPVVIAEELLHQDGDFSSSLIDYKLYCTHGKNQFCAVMYNRTMSNHAYDINLYDNNWEDISGLIGSYPNVNSGKGMIPRPHNFDLMKRFCKDVCSEFPFVRMDFYECYGNLYFGEFTFTPGACFGRPLGEKACKILSDNMNLPL